MNTFISTYQALQESIDTNFVVKDLDDFDLFDASFILDTLNLLIINPGNTLGIYRLQDDVFSRSFISKPYVHETNANKIYNPIITPKKKTFAQRLGISSEPYKEGDFTISESYSPEFLLSGVVDRRVLKDIYGGSALNLIQYICIPKNEEAVWQMFLLDNIEYFLPKFDHGAYRDRKLVFTTSDISSFPASVQNFVNQNNDYINPIIRINEMEEQAFVQCTYFNKWEGLVRWTCFYQLFEGFGNGQIRMTKINHREHRQIMVKYDCGIRF